jgi:hypothetical protein
MECETRCRCSAGSSISSRAKSGQINYYAPMIYTAYILFWMRAYPLRGEVGGGWALEFPSFLGPVKWERADRRKIPEVKNHVALSL